MRDGHGPLGVGTQREAGDAEDRRLLLDTAGVGDDRGGTADEAHELDVAERVDDAHARVVEEAGLLEAGATARVQRDDDLRLVGDGVHRGDEGLDVLRVVDIARAVQRGDDVVALDADLLTHGVGVEAGLVLEQGVDHRVADEVDLVGVGALVAQVADRVGARREEQVRELVGDEAVDLLGHRHVEGAQAGLDVGEGDAELARHEGSGHGGVDVAVDDDEVGAALGEELLEGDHHLGRLGAVRAGTDTEIDVGLGDAQLAEEDVRHLVVVVLAGVHEQLLDVVSGQGLEDRGGLGEVGTRTGDVHNKGSHVSPSLSGGTYSQSVCHGRPGPSAPTRRTAQVPKSGCRSSPSHCSRALARKCPASADHVWPSPACRT